uniref:U4/U6.U5 small nuclear ribonucleoprotein 27 kDa protein n=1 Tax=Photinus pyralis TaxID=7054 RepID=A0A1Y1N9H7_PHOPY
MGRSRSRSKSPSRRRERERERERDRRRRKRSRDKSRDRSKERDRRRQHSHDRDNRRRFSRSRSRSLDREKKKSNYVDKPTITAADLEGKTPDEQDMLRMMGFCNFDTTKNKKVDGNDVGGVHVILKRKYRQYMNRKGGFNRPLDFVA